jgi:HlyD family secretion protein
MKRLPILIAILAGVAVILVAAKMQNRADDPALAVRLSTIRPSTFQTKLPENGVVQHPRTATIPTLVAGNLGVVYVKPGDRVYQGQLVATVQNPQLEANAASSQADYDQARASIGTARTNSQNAQVGYQAALSTTKSALDEAKRIYESDVALYSQGAIPLNQLDVDKAKYVQLQVQYAQAVRQLKLGAVVGYAQDSVQIAEATARKMAIVNASNQQQLSFERIIAPFAGIIQSIATQPNDPLTPLRAGDPVTQGQALFTIAEGSTYIVKAQVDEQDVMSVHVGQPVIVTGQDFPERHIAGHVAQIAPIATKSTDASSTAKQVLTTIRLDSSPPFLKDGMTVDVDILTTDIHNALVVPSDAIVTEKGKSYVYAVENGVAHKTPVKIGKSNDAQTIVRSGIAPGTVIVAQKAPALKDGARVTAASSSPTPAAST